MKADIEKIINFNERFSITIDEWTSSGRKRYMSINLHHMVKRFSLGMIRVEGSLPAEKALQMIKNSLQSFGINLVEHVVTLTTDGPNAMKKLGRISLVNHQLCHSHGLHLAVCDLLYKKSTRDEELPIQEQEVEPDNSGIWIHEVPDLPEDLEFLADKKRAIEKVRHLSTFFNRSPVRNDILQRESQR